MLAEYLYKENSYHINHLIPGTYGDTYERVSHRTEMLLNVVASTTVSPSRRDCRGQKSIRNLHKPILLPLHLQNVYRPRKLIAHDTILSKKKRGCFKSAVLL